MGTHVCMPQEFRAANKIARAMSENEAPLAAALVPSQSADAWVVSQLASALR